MADQSEDESDFASAESEPEDDGGVVVASGVAVAAGREPVEPVVTQPQSPVRDETAPADSPQPNKDDDSSPAAVTADNDDSPHPEATAESPSSAGSAQEGTASESPRPGGERSEGGQATSAAERTTEDTPAESGGGGGGWGGWGGWGGLWSSVSTVTESAQALGSKVSSVIASVEDTLGLPSPHELGQGEGGGGGGGGGEGAEFDDETSKLAEEMVEHDVPPEDLPPPIQEEPHSGSGPPSPKKDITTPPPDAEEQHEAAAHSPSSFGFSSFLTGIASAMQSTSKEIGKASLDALETLGKRTFEVLSEGDPGLQKTRSTLAGSKGPTLSQLLLEAKASSDSHTPPADCISRLPLSYSRLFDEYHGVVHLEALELLSKECERKIRSSLASFSGDELRSVKGSMEELQLAFEVEDLPEVLDDDSSQLHEITELFSTMALPLKVDRLIKVSSSWRDKVETTMAELKTAGEEAVKQEDKEEEEESTGEGGEASCEAGEGGEASSEGCETVTKEDKKTACFEALYGNGVSSLAEMTSTSIELFRKMGEVLLLPDQSHKHDVLEQAQKFNRLTVLVSAELDSLASVHAEAITQLDLKDCNSNITSLYLEASNSCTYVQDAFQLLCPVLKHTLIQQQLPPLQKPSTHTLERN